MFKRVSVRRLKAFLPARGFTRLAVFVSLAALLYAAPAPNRRNGIAAALATADFKTMHTIFAQAHASAFKQVPAGESPDLFKDSGTVSIRDFVIRALRYYRDLKVDHTGLGFSPELINELGLRNALFPFPLKLDRKSVV